MKRQNSIKVLSAQDIGYFICLGIGIVALLGSVMLRFIKINLWEKLPVCAFYSTTGYYCFGCGGTRAVKALFHGRLLDCIYYHPFVMYAVVLYTGYIVMGALHLISKGRIKAMPLLPAYGYIGAVLIIVQCLVKNYLVYQFGWQI